MKKLEQLLAKAALVVQAAHSELLRLHPVGSEVRFMIMHGQRNASTGTVVSVGYGNPGYLRVKHHEAKKNSRYAYRDVHYTQIVK